MRLFFLIYFKPSTVVWSRLQSGHMGIPL